MITSHRESLPDIAPQTLYRLLKLRVDVFVVEQAAAYPELDGRDDEPDTEHFWVEEEGEILATLRLLRDPDAARIGRVATAVSARGRGLAAELMRQAVKRAAERWPQHPIDLDAQAHLAPWYGRFGFVVNGREFVEDDIPHLPMRRAAGIPLPAAG
ncbi:MAG: GNAT family N-acetyltransferase [Microbacterium sp.]|uniref:GNAT family N-acetyltransferase n=1 Tax=Microbacterium sp. TaxID=51671 RepID=UPI002619A764|nr:GNAT family N-acetyltransferase [Microbacterium sp.]MCX6502930.1 GNAT family N-acetyltransferase [Microbacterium sp.]